MRITLPLAFVGLIGLLPSLASSQIADADAKFAHEDFEGALETYQTVIDSGEPDPNVGYAMYKIGWCYFNLGQPRKALAQFEKVINYNDQVGGSKSLREEAVKDLVKAFSLWPEGDPRKARGYLSKFVNDDKDKLDDLMERLAQFYTESGQIDRAIFVYRDLIKDNSKSFKSVHYQTQIMYAVETQNDIHKTADVIAATIQLYKQAKDDPSFSDKTPKRLQQSYQEIKAYTLETAKWYHRVSYPHPHSAYTELSLALFKLYLENFIDPQQDPNAIDL
jgi:tetratricopeptide (TPR) repeat protein